MGLKLPSIPEPGNDPATQLNTLRVIKQVVELLAANATGDKNVAGPGTGAQIFALQDDVKQLIKNQAAILSSKVDQGNKDLTLTVESAVADLNQDISDARNRAIQARADALEALDVFEQEVAQTVYEFNQELGDTKASVTEEAGARAKADEAISGRIVKAAAFVGLNEATWKQGDISVADRFSAMSSGYASYVARTGDNFLGSYTQHVVTTTTFNDAVATKVNNLETKLTVPSTPGRPDLLLSSAILDEANATTDVNKKIATAQNINTTVASLSDVAGQNGATSNGAITAAVKVESDARVSALNNIKATAAYSVVVNTSGPAGPAVTGFRAVSDSTSTTPISDFQIFADKFRITNGSATKTPFSIDAVNSKINMSADVSINGNLVVTGTIDSPQIKNGAVSSLGFVSGVGTQAIKIAVRPNASVQVIAVYNAGDTATASERFANFDNTSTTNAPSRPTFSVMGNIKVRRYECYDSNFTNINFGTISDKNLPVLGYLQSTTVVGDGFLYGNPTTYFHRITWTYSSFSANDIMYFKNSTELTKYLVYEVSTDFSAVNGYSISATELAR